MRVDVVSIFPEYLAPLRLSLAGKAQDSGVLDVRVHDLRDWTHDRHRTVDDTPYGGGAGMVMRPEPWGEALDALATEGAVLVVPTPSGEPFTQALAAELATVEHLLFACGRYEGIDQRVLDEAAARMTVREVSLGDYVLNGGEVAALVARTGCWSTPSTRSRPPGAATTCPRCCCPATTPGSRRGGTTRPYAGPPPGGRTCCTRAAR